MDAVIGGLRRLMAESRPTPPLLTLPNELLLQIIADVDVFDTVHLRLTCKRFSSVAPLVADQDANARSDFLQSIERKAHNFNTHAACYGCIKLLPKFKSLDVKIIGEFDKYDPRA